MKKLLFAAALCGMAMIQPALAVSNHTVLAIQDGQQDHLQWDGLRGRIDRISLLARGGDVDCNLITVRYADDGTTKAVFSGLLYRGERQVISLRAERLRDIKFACAAESGG